MQRTLSFLLAAVLGGGIPPMAASSAVAGDRDNDRQTAAEVSTPAFPDGMQVKDLGQLNDIRDELAKITYDAFTRGDFGKLIKNLASENRDRMKDFKDQDFKTLDGVIAQINQDWNQKYGHDFSIKHASDVYTDQQVIVQGVVTNPQVATVDWPVPAAGHGNEARLAAGRERADSQIKQVEADDLRKSTGVALVRFPVQEGLPTVTASLIREKGEGWRVDAPANLSSQQIHTQLQNQLTEFDQQKANWPADENAAYRLATHRVLMALYDVNANERDRERTR